MAKITVCDRCGKKQNNGLVITGPRMVRMVLGGGASEFNYDLCTDCTHRLKEWMKSSHDRENTLSVQLTPPKPGRAQ